MTDKKKYKKEERFKVKTFTVPFAIGKLKENITLNTNKKYKPSKEEIIIQASKFHSQGNISEAAKYYQYFIDQGFKDYRVFSNFGAILKDLGKLKEAELSFLKAIELNPDFAIAHSNLGNVLRDLGKLKEAELSIREAIKLKPNNAEAHSNLGGILIDLDQIKEAELSFHKAIELNPNLASPHYYLGKIFSDLGNLKEAEASFKKAIKLKFTFNQAYDGLTSVLKKLGRNKEAEESSNRVLYLNSLDESESQNKKSLKSNFSKQPAPIEYPLLYRPGMGTENIGGFLRSMAMMLRPKRVLEIGAGYTTPFLLEALINNERVYDDGNLRESYFENYTYEAKLVIIDNQSQGELIEIAGMKEIIDSNYTEFIEGKFQGKAKDLYEKYGHFDFVWFDCGGPNEYLSFIQEFWEYCSNYIFFHFTYHDGKPNGNHKIIREHIKGNPIMIDIVEPHKRRQGSVTLVKKEDFEKNKN